MKNIILIVLCLITLLNFPFGENFLNAATIETTKHITVIDIDKWNHSTKKVFEINNFLLTKVELYKNKTYPVFYVVNGGDKTIYDANLINSLVKNNNYWSLKLIEGRKYVEITCNRKQKKIVKVFSDKGYIDLKKNNALSLEEAIQLAEKFCRKPNVGVEAHHNAKYDLMIKNEKYYYFDMIYGMLMGDKPNDKDEPITALFVNVVNKSVYEAIEQDSNGKIAYKPGKKLIPTRQYRKK